MILGNGPSLADIPIEPLKQHPQIDLLTVNHPDGRVWPTTYWVFCDLSQYRRHQEYWRNYKGIVVTSTTAGKTRDLVGNRESEVIYVRNLGGKGFSRQLPNGVFVGRSTVYASMQIALWCAYRKVYVLGCDMGAAADGRVWSYGLNPDASPQDRLRRFDLEAEFYDHAATLLDQTERARFQFASDLNRYQFTSKYGSGLLSHVGIVERILAEASS